MKRTRELPKYFQREGVAEALFMAQEYGSLGVKLLEFVNKEEQIVYTSLGHIFDDLVNLVKCKAIRKSQQFLMNLGYDEYTAEVLEQTYLPLELLKIKYKGKLAGKTQNI